MPSDHITALRPPPRSADLDCALGRAVARRRRGLQISEEGLGARVGRSGAFIASLEAGRMRISAAMVVALARALGVSGLALLQEADAGRRRADA